MQTIREKGDQRRICFCLYSWCAELDLDRVSVLANHYVALCIWNDVEI
jgi:hypothetical protein